MAQDIKKLRCGECGHRGLVWKDLNSWYEAPIYSFPKVKITKSIKMPTCPKCSNVVIFGNLGENLSVALEQSVCDLTVSIIEETMEKCGLTARKLSKILGVTPEYLSMLQHRKKVASFQLVQLLLVLRDDPSTYTKLAKFWKIDI